jgi:hypothetical protein
MTRVNITTIIKAPFPQLTSGKAKFIIFYFLVL